MTETAVSHNPDQVLRALPYLSDERAVIAQKATVTERLDGYMKPAGVLLCCSVSESRHCFAGGYAINVTVPVFNLAFSYDDSLAGALKLAMPTLQLRRTEVSTAF